MTVPVDPLIYRFHEITQIYGTTIKALIHEMFGDGIMSAIDFEMDIQKIEDPKGDRVVVTYNGRMVENLHVASAQRTLSIHDAITALGGTG